jgi:hypothetical protein
MKLSKRDCYAVCTALRVMENETGLSSHEYGIWVRLITFLDFPEDIIQSFESKRLEARANEVFELA